MLLLLNSLTLPTILSCSLVWLKPKTSSTLENWKISILTLTVCNVSNLLTGGNSEEPSDLTSTDFIMLTKTEISSYFRNSFENNSKSSMKSLAILSSSTGTNSLLIKPPFPMESDSSTLYLKYLNSSSKSSSLFMKCS